MWASFQAFLWDHKTLVRLTSSHLLFVDETLIFCGANPSQLHYLCALFLCSEAVSGFKIYLAKSELVPVGNDNNVDGLTSIMGYGVSYLPLKYLGLLLETSFKAKSIWDGVIEKIECRLASWKMMHLSKGGRNHLDQEHPIQFAYIFHVYFSPPYWCCQSQREVTTRFLME
jgi:hypothetical protein